MIRPLCISSCISTSLLCLATLSSQAGATDISNTPLSSASNFAVAPNFMFILDDSGSMASDYLPDQVIDGGKCKQRTEKDSWGNTITTDDCRPGDPPYFAAEFNTIYYNPKITYLAPKNYDSSTMANQSDPTKVLDDGFTSTTTIDLTTQYPEMVYCNTSGTVDMTKLSDWTKNCRQNGAVTSSGGTVTLTASPGFQYPVTVTGTLNSTASYPDGTYKYPKTKLGAPYYFTISPKEYCSDVNLTTCVLATAASGSNTFPAPVRWCKDTSSANSTSAVSGSGKCQLKYDGSHTYPRYGNLLRVNIVSGRTFPKASTRSDCGTSTCSYNQEITNFGNWYAYYRTRLKMMKTSAGRAFDRLNENYRVGFITINPGDIKTSGKYLKISEFNSTQRQAWYTTFYAQTAGSRTPLREALSRVGRYYAHQTDGINAGMDDDPVQYSCQQNFALLTTDGYWNGTAGQTVSGKSIGNQDNTDATKDPKWSSRAGGTYDGNLKGADETLADVALYYYKTDLRPAGSKGALGADVSKPNVPTTDKDINPEQHMVTFTLGIVDGLMLYKPDYETSKSGDFANIKAGSKGCTWSASSTTTCDWPVPKADDMSALDDLWHAAVNGRGKFYLAQDPKAVSTGLGDAISSMQVRIASAAASATSSPNITPTDRSIFSSTYTTVEWAGEIVAQDIDPKTGNVISTIKWSAQKQLDAMVSDKSDSRTIYMRDPTGTNAMKKFDYSLMAAEDKVFFDSRCSLLSQCPDLDATQQADANNGANLVAFLRGQTGFNGTIYRNRPHALGDTVNSKPVYVRSPVYAFTDTGYATFKSNNSSRQAVLYIAANDGMVHAINADTGNEIWAYIPRMVMPDLYRLADKSYSNQHRYYVDGWIQVMDVYDGTQWRTVLVGGLNSGGRGYYALDITTPSTPKSLWEFCHTDTLCKITDTDLGLTYGTPVITKRADGKWVVLLTSGYNNVSPGDGKGYLYVLDVVTGKILSKVGTGAGDTTTPAGLARISAWAESPSKDNTAQWVYGGDLLGNVWRFDMTGSTPSVLKLAQLADGSGRPQSVTTRPELSEGPDGSRLIFVGTGRYLGVSDLQDPATWSPKGNDAYQQSMYAFKDTDTTYSDLRKSLVKQDIQPVSAIARTSSTNTVDLKKGNGWYVDFNPNDESPGERVNIDPQLVMGTLLVVTNVPNKDACSLGGDSWLYQFDAMSGTYVSTSADQLVAKKLTNAITVGLVVFRLPDLELKYIATDSGGGKTPGAVNIPNGTVEGKRTSWRELIR